MAGMIDGSLFEYLKTSIEEDSKTKEELNQAVQALEKNVTYTQGILSRVHSTPRASYPRFIPQVEVAIAEQIKDVTSLAAIASRHPYYKYNQFWNRKIQDAIFTVLLCAWLGGMNSTETPAQLGRLLSLDDVGKIFQVPVNLKDRDLFHITIEEYLMATANLTDELTRLAVNSVTLDDYELAVKISAFVKDLYAGFQLLNLKNDFLRKRVDGIKYSVKKVEDVVYDLSLRNLLPKQQE